MFERRLLCRWMWAWLLSCGVLLSQTSCTALKKMEGNQPRTGTMIPDSTLKISPSLGIPLEKVVNWGLYAGAAYLILDPLAPNWELEEAHLGEAYIHMDLKMRRYYAGGAGEARVVFHRRAKALVQTGGYGSYQVIEYSEGLESSMLGSQRVAQGVIRLIARADQGSAPPARKISESVEKPVS